MRLSATILIIGASAVTASPVTAQEIGGGQVARSAAGQAGQRQTRNNAAEEGILPLDRINSRITNRVESRLRNRIDRFYDPQANATSPFDIAGERARAATRQGGVEARSRSPHR